MSIQTKICADKILLIIKLYLYTKKTYMSCLYTLDKSWLITYIYSTQVCLLFWNDHDATIQNCNYFSFFKINCIKLQSIQEKHENTKGLHTGLL
jgi:hypothetical protein